MPLIFVVAIIWYFFLPVAEVAIVNAGHGLRGGLRHGANRTDLRVHVRAQNSGFIRLADAFSAGRGAIGESG